MTFPVIVTRTSPGVYKTVTKLKEVGVKPIASSLLTVKFAEAAEIPIDPAVTIFTSENGVRSYAQLTDRRDSRVYCIGAATQAVAEELGWTVLASSQGGANEFLGLLEKNIDPSEGLVLHPTNTRTAYGITEMLQDRGYTVQMVDCYTTERKRKLSKKAADALQSDDCVVMFYSTEAVLAFLDIQDSRENKDVRIIGLSENIVSNLRRVGFRRIWVAEKPIDDAMLNVLTLPEFCG